MYLLLLVKPSKDVFSGDSLPPRYMGLEVVWVLDLRKPLTPESSRPNNRPLGAHILQGDFIPRPDHLSKSENPRHALGTALVEVGFRLLFLVIASREQSPREMDIFIPGLVTKMARQSSGKGEARWLGQP